MTPDFYILIDLEATCWRGGKPRRSEIIEIGATCIDSKTLDVVDKFQTFVKPVVNPILSEFCNELTTIEQTDVDNAPEFSVAMSMFYGWVDEKEGSWLWGSWGDYDRRMFERDCQFKKVEYLFPAHFNVKVEFGEWERNVFRPDGKTKGWGMAKALAKLNMTLEGVPHRADSDALNISRIFKHIRTRTDLLKA